MGKDKLQAGPHARSAGKACRQGHSLPEYQALHAGNSSYTGKLTRSQHDRGQWVPAFTGQVQVGVL